MYKTKLLFLLSIGIVASIDLLSEKELEILSEFKPEDLAEKYDITFLKQINDAAFRRFYDICMIDMPGAP